MAIISCHVESKVPLKIVHFAILNAMCTTFAERKAYARPHINKDYVDYNTKFLTYPQITCTPDWKNSREYVMKYSQPSLARIVDKLDLGQISLYLVFSLDCAAIC